MFEKDELVTIKIPFTANKLPMAVWSKGNEEIKPSDTYQDNEPFSYAENQKEVQHLVGHL